MLPSDTKAFKPALALRFSVVLGGKPFENITACEGLDAHYEVYEFTEGGNAGHAHRLPVGVRYTNVRLSRAVDAKSGELATWFSAVRTSMTRTTATIRAHNTQGEVVASWELAGVWPVRYSGPRFSSTGTAAAIETIELAHNGFMGGGS